MNSTEFKRLLSEFSSTFSLTPKGQKHINFYPEQRQQGQQNFAQIHADYQQGKDITTDVLLKLLPHTDTKTHQEAGAWIHIAPCITGDIQSWYESSGWTQSEDWPNIAQAIYSFISRCKDNPEELTNACNEFASHPYNKGLQTGMMTPILNALNPDQYLLINNKSRAVINHLAGSKHSQKLIDYPTTNQAGRELIKGVTPELHNIGIEGIRPDDLFDMFSHWLVSIKKHKFQETAPASKLAPKPEKDYPFTETAFGLLAELHAEPRASVYKAKHEAFQEYLIQPFKRVFQQVAQHLPSDITTRMEVSKRLFSQIKKNDFRHGGAWDFYWGAFYPKDEKRTESAQLYMWMNHEQIEIGFYIGVYGKEQRKLFIQNCQKNPDAIVDLLAKRLMGTDILFGARNQYSEGTYGDFRIKNHSDIDQALQSIESDDIHITRIFPKAQVLQMTQADFETVMLETYQTVFPFVLLAMEVEPFPLIQNYVEPGTITQVEKEKHLHTDLPHPNPLEAASHQGLTPYSQNSLLQKVSNTRAKDVEKQFTYFAKENPDYSLSDCAADLSTNEGNLQTCLQALERKGQVIFYGPPGTGKTYLAQKIAKHLQSGGHGFTQLVQFHPAYSYEDFIQGIRPQQVEGGLDYPIVPGRFLKFCQHAAALSPKDLCVLIIDEINRANLSQVFGELMYSLEYRDAPIHLATGETFSIPANVRILGTMNTADRSIALVDHALRRRFAFLHVPPNYELLQTFHNKTEFPVEGLIQELKSLNLQICDRNYEIGPSYFLLDNLSEHLEGIWKTEIEPYLEEFFFDQPDKVEQFSWSQVQSKIKA